MTVAPQSHSIQHVLATDLDGTFIPMSGNEQQRADLHTLAQQLELNQVTLVFVTGRHFESVLKAIQSMQLPNPDWIICDVGTSIYQRLSSGEFQLVTAYQQLQDRIVEKMPRADLQERLDAISGLRLQEEQKQGRFKLSYYVDATQLETCAARVQEFLRDHQAPYSIIKSVDPFTEEGLIDVLPQRVSKAHALDWWMRHIHLLPGALVFAGDSGNDLAALTAGHRAIVVGNADRQLAREVYDEHREAGWRNRLYLAQQEATSGVLEGCRWYGLADASNVECRKLGATPITCSSTHFRAWAPERARVEVEVSENGDSSRHLLARDQQGYFSATVQHVPPGTAYQYVLDGRLLRPDPASRYQPDGVHGASQVINPNSFPWTDQRWQGIAKRDLIIYELHIGTFTDAGTFRAAMERLPQLVALGITAIEVMPVAQTPGRWNWGYDGVDLFAVRNSYGTPDDFKAFVDACHELGLAVILDVVYNHIGPEGNYLSDFGPYISPRHSTPWGDAFNFDAGHSETVRRWIQSHALFWLSEYHLDGLRLDAVHFMFDDSTPHILDDIRLAVTDFAETSQRKVHLIAETNVYDEHLLGRSGRPAYDAIWCDCLMHAIYSYALPDLQLTQRKYVGGNDLATVLAHGYVFADPEQERVNTSGIHPAAVSPPPLDALVTALQNHDCIGNHPQGKRLHQLTSPSFQRAAAALTLLYPSIPLLFMGEEFASASTFPFFADYEDDHLRMAVDRGRADEHPQHAWEDAVSPSDPAAHEHSVLKWPETPDTHMVAWYQQLIKLRKRGISKGWLSQASMTTAHDVQRDIFSITYSDPEGTRILIQARLSPVATSDREPVGIPCTGDLLLSSEADLQSDEGRIWLKANHAIVTQSHTE
jgi:maltooligosyltrehalose trehalohydrolase